MVRSADSRDNKSSMAENTPSSPFRFLLIVLGLLFVGLGGLGIVLPGLPTTPFLLLAAACFAKSSPRLHGWLLANRVFGELIRNWQEHRTIPRRAKAIGLVTLFLVGGFSVYSLNNLSLKFSVLALLLLPSTILIRLKTTESVVNEERGDDPNR